MRRIRGRRLRAIAFLMLIAFGLFVLSRYLLAKGLVWASEWSNVVALFIAILALVGPLIIQLFRQPQPMSQVGVAQAGDDLATSLRKQWVEEDRLRRINDPRPLPVRWEVTPTAQAAMTGVPSGGTSDDDEEPPLKNLAGKFDEILTVFNQVQSHRLVILGVAGAGKTALAIKLARELLAARRSGMPIPVIMPMAAWSPDKRLAEWISSQLELNHPGLALRVKGVTGETTSLSLALTYESILPILDGLDELPENVRIAAVSEINVMGSDSPVVVTSRPDEYLRAIDGAGRGISRAMAVELLPLRAEEVKHYLHEATAMIPERRWLKVFNRLDSEPDGPLAKVLTTPLMLWLTRTVYEHAKDDPSELADDDRFKNEEQIEQHLLDAFVPAVYGSKSDRSGFNCSATQAQRWLKFIATYLEKTGSPDLAWWRFTLAVRHWRPLGVTIRTVLALVAGWTLTVALLKRNGYWQNPHRHIYELLFGGSLGRLARPSVDQSIGILLRYHTTRHFFNVVFTPLRWFSWNSLPWLALQIGLIAFIAGLVSSLDPFLAPRALGVSFFRSPQVIARLFITPIVVVGYLLFFPLLYKATKPITTIFLRTDSGHIFLLSIALLLFVTSVPPLAAPVDETRATSPVRVLRLDRTATWLTYLVINALPVTVFFLVAGRDVAFTYFLWTLVVVLVRIVLGSVVSASWLFDDARIWLAGSRRLPWRTMSFLIDAHKRGVLRQVGTVYQFRHIRLQQRLSEADKISLGWSLILKIACLIDPEYSYYYKAPIKTIYYDEHGWQVKKIGPAMWVYRDPRFDQRTRLRYEVYSPESGDMQE